MKKLLNIVFVILVFVAFVSCGNDKKEEIPEIDIYATTEESTIETIKPQKSELIVFADDSLTEFMNAIKQEYESQYTNTNIICKFDTSESLKNQIVNIADCDVFISSDPNILDMIDGTKGNDVNPEMFDFIEQGSRVEVFKDNRELNQTLAYEACIIRIGLNIDEAKRFIDYITNI